MRKSPELIASDSQDPLLSPDHSFENVNYVPLLPLMGVNIGRHSEMILPNSNLHF
jgi:hypothetical protein